MKDIIITTLCDLYLKKKVKNWLLNQVKKLM